MDRDDGGYRLEVLRTQLLEAQSLAMAGKRTEAGTAVRRLVADSTACGALTIAAFAGTWVEPASPGRAKKR